MAVRRVLILHSTVSRSVTGTDSDATIIGSCTKQTPCSVLHVSISHRQPTYAGVIAHARSSVLQDRPPRQGPLNRLRTHPPVPPHPVLWGGRPVKPNK